MKSLLKHVSKVLDSDSYVQSVKKVSDGLTARTNKVAQRNKSFFKFSPRLRSALFPKFIACWVVGENLLYLLFASHFLIHKQVQSGRNYIPWTTRQSIQWTPGS